MDGALTVVRLGLLHLSTVANPELWWEVHGDHPVGNLNMSLCRAVTASAEEGAAYGPAVEVDGIGTMTLKGGGVELQELFRSFARLYSESGQAAGKEWQLWEDDGRPDLGAFVGTTGGNIAIIGRAEKRLVVAAARFILDNDLVANATSMMNAVAMATLDQLIN